MFLPLVALSSCGGYSLEYLVKGDLYLSPVFERNFYDHWDIELKNAPLVSNVLISESGRILKFDDLWKIDPNFSEISIDEDTYGKNYCLMHYDDSFKYGVQSKLFDGEVFCYSRQQKVRVQIRPSGFSARFQKESDELTYFAMQFKAAIDYTTPEGQAIGRHDSIITKMTVSIYTKDGLKIVRNDFVTNNIRFDNGWTNYSEGYQFYAFNLPSLSRAVGVSVTYEYDDPSIKGTDLAYSLFLYEIFLPYTNWH